MLTPIWEEIAKYVEKTYGVFVDWEEGFFICPECGEPIYECDWEEEDEDPFQYDGYTAYCPICENLIYEKED